ncbi:hypothetical protein [Erwinia psidii]|uniref:Uncharacterized protein n=1 Tax=Erwinia psidii TaxID=69224 RepID=A0A3N6S0X6_9GAMM|nr:hypothetical protein [Erwinia psidii]MCX8957831.1 hypothetical protein [Erwinia psidii]MCX8960881.1 hypothetical protein [Erwinia psidii]MCX8964879.1 hypothetical protein [Erwinia psidii]RQM38447.1 hypothetical protein EB241_09465 [Erwinia psidii]
MIPANKDENISVNKIIKNGTKTEPNTIYLNQDIYNKNTRLKRDERNFIYRKEPQGFNCNKKQGNIYSPHHEFINNLLTGITLTFLFSLPVVMYFFSYFNPEEYKNEIYPTSDRHWQR